MVGYADCIRTSKVVDGRSHRAVIYPRRRTTLGANCLFRDATEGIRMVSDYDQWLCPVTLSSDWGLVVKTQQVNGF